MQSLRSAILDSADRPAGLLSALGLTESRTDVAATWVSAAYRGIALLWPLVLLAKICVSALLHIPLGFAAASGAGWLAVGLAVILLDLIILALPRLRVFGGLLPHVQTWVLLPLVILSGVAFSLWLALGQAGDEVGGWLTLTATFCIALLVTGIVGDRRLLAFGYVLGALLVPTLLHGDFIHAGLLVSCLSVMALATMRQAIADRDRALDDRRRDLQVQRSDRLLQDYERSGRGWFWETDRNGCISYVSETLVATMGASSTTLIGRPITDMICHGDRQQGDGERTLGFHLSARSGFADIAVRAAMTQDERWWSISGQPIFNEYGQFHGFRGSGTDLTEMRRSQAEVVRLAQYDSLTGLANRVQMLRSLEQAVTSVRGQPGDCSLLMLDLDRFKYVNDTLGHPAGDALLRQVSQRLQRVVGDQGLVGRQGGDEFKILLPGRVEHAALVQLADIIIASLSQPYSIEGSRVVIGVSIGISSCPIDGVTADALIRNADLALYAAKGDGRGIHRFYSPEMHADAEDRRQLEEDLRQALASDALHLVYQPVVNARTEQITGYEALLRWEHPVRGAISPNIFIPIAEDTGLIAQIGEWVLRTACQDAAGWTDGARVAVNVSPIQFANPAFPSTVMNVLASTQLAPERLELEITESVFLNDNDGTDAMFARLKSLGVRLALDDFGTGYSSLGYLKKAPFDKIKIDQSFVRGAAIKGSRNSAIIKAIVSLAEALGMDTTAEGAETQDELDLIRQLGCSHIQGYIYGRPILGIDIMARQTGVKVIAQSDGFRSSRPERKSMLRTISVHHDGQVYGARVRNISATGALVEGLWNVPEGTRFAIELAEGQLVQATARWSKDDRMGVEFDEGIDLVTLRTSAVPRALAS
ncbi:EAL domain-containing protein [Sphingobium aromaticiconvertens]|uniref:EAL domain-containing protein n=1 Tax=Sphingobium aromaticiconvertens TaxID=365341 RepID=UPI00301A761F